MSFLASQHGVIGDFCEYYVDGLMDLQVWLKWVQNWIEDETTLANNFFFENLGCERARPRMVARGSKELN